MSTEALRPTQAESVDCFSPGAIRFWLSGRCTRPGQPGGCHWLMLESAVEGGSGASGLGSGKGDRLGLVLLKADLERAADSLPLYWQSTEFVFIRQHRAPALYARRHATPEMPVEQRIAEHPVPSVALEGAIWRMAAFLGWKG